MITGSILALILVLLQFFVNLLPVAAFPTEIAIAIGTMWGYVTSYNFLFPVSTLLTILGIAMIFHATLLVWRLANFIGHYIRGN